MHLRQHFTKPSNLEDTSASKIPTALCSKGGAAQCVSKRAAQKIENGPSKQVTTLSTLVYSILFYVTEIREQNKDITEIKETEKEITCPPYLTDHIPVQIRHPILNSQRERSAILLASKRSTS
jgi:hypothetical protein